MNDDEQGSDEAFLHELQNRIAELEQLHQADQHEVAALRKSEDEANARAASLREDNHLLEEQLVQEREANRNVAEGRDKADGEKRDSLKVHFTKFLNRRETLTSDL